MSQGVLDRTRFERIEAYVLGSMSLDERALFDQELAHEPTLRAEMELQRENTLAIELGGMERMLRSVGAEHAGTSSVRGSDWSRYLKYAAVIALVLSGTFWVSTRPSRSERLFADNFTADPGLPVAMSATNDLAFQDAMVAYKLGDYAEARSKWSEQLQAAPANATLRFYIASAALAMDDQTAAVPLFESIAADPASAFHTKAQWYLFLAYVKAGDIAKAKALPIDDDPTYGERARVIKAELK